MTALHSRAWTRLPSGRHLDLVNPDPNAWLDEDVALRLARTPRWAGESTWPWPLSVAQHSLTVLALRRQWAEGPLPRPEALLELLHDAEEGFLGFDCISPLKDVLGIPFRAVSSRLFSAVLDRYELQPWDAAQHPLHKRADCTAAASEAVHCVGWSPSEVRTVLSIPHPILEVDPLAELYDCRPWEPWSADLAAERFWAEFSGLLGRHRESSLPIGRAVGTAA